MCWMAFGESMGSVGMQEDTFKLFVGGGYLSLRRNHEAETHQARCDRFGESRNMNPGDIPYVKGEMESPYKRRPRCIRIQSKFTRNMAEVDAGKNPPR